MSQSSPEVMIWWAALSVVAFFNTGLLVYARWVLDRKRSNLPTDLFRIRNQQWMLAAVYVLGCGFRSILPRGDVHRIVLYDSWLSSVAIGRSVATVAELAFVAQWALLLHEIGRSTENTTIARLAMFIVPLITIAELFSWYGVLTTNYLGNTVEESIWALTATIAVTGFVVARPYYEKTQRLFLNTAIVLGVGYIGYMALVDVPTYFSNYQASQAAGVRYLTIAEGLSEVASRWTVRRTFESWRYAMVWMSLYFSFAVWMSIFIVNAPRMDAGLKRAQG